MLVNPRTVPEFTRRQEADGAALKQEVSQPSGIRMDPRGRRHDVGGQVGIFTSLTRAIFSAYKGFTTTVHGWPWIKGDPGDVPPGGGIPKGDPQHPLALRGAGKWVTFPVGFQKWRRDFQTSSFRSPLPTANTQ